MKYKDVEIKKEKIKVLGVGYFIYHTDIRSEKLTDFYSVVHPLNGNICFRSEYLSTVKSYIDTYLTLDGLMRQDLVDLLVKDFSKVEILYNKYSNDYSFYSETIRFLEQPKEDLNSYKDSVLDRDS